MDNKKYNLTLSDVCEKLGRTRKSVSGYIKRGKLKPIQVKSEKGTLEYRFTEEDLEKFHGKKEKFHGKEDRKLHGKFLGKNDGKGQEISHEISGENVTSSEFVALLKEQLNVKDEQLKADRERHSSEVERKDKQLSEFIERIRELNHIVEGLRQDNSRLLTAGNPKTRKDVINAEVGQEEETTQEQSYKKETTTPPPFKSGVKNESKNEEKKDTYYDIAIKTINDPLGTAKNAFSTWWKGKR